MTGIARVTLYSRPGCHLCAEARTAIAGLRADYEFTLEEIDIDCDDALLRRHLERIPVIELEGELVSELVFDPEALRARLDTVQAVRGEGSTS